MTATNNNAAARYLGGMDQTAHRGTAVWYDQHRSSTYRDAEGVAIFEDGRPYYSIIELKTRMPVGPVMPLGWRAPLMPPQQYLLKSIGKIAKSNRVVAEGLQKTVVTDRIHIDYETMKRDDEEATLAHWRRAVQEAAHRDWEPPHFGAPMDRRLLELVGPAPRSPRIAQAFMAGDPWALGMLMPVYNPVTGRHEVEDNPELRRLVTLNRPDLLTPEQFEREYGNAAQPVGDEATELRALLAEAREAIKALDAQKAEKRKGGRPAGSKNKPKEVEAGV